MSSVYGYCTIENRQTAAKFNLSALGYWNRPYGREAEETLADTNWALGCCIEHLTERYPFGGPILRDGEQLAVIDAVLYNRETLLETLEAPADTSDEDLLFQFISRKGMDALAQVNGDFAGAVFNRRDGSWILFRDHMGVRPLYWLKDGSGFAFSTDLRGLTAITEGTVNENQLFLRMMGYNDLSLLETEFAGIHCVPPASWLRVIPGEKGWELENHRYWRLRQKKLRLKNEKAYAKAMGELITDAVKRRLDAVSGLVGGELSGGLDSGVVDILISRLGREGRFFSWSQSPEEQPLREGEDERKIIRDICLQENISCDYCRFEDRMSPEEMLQRCHPPFVNTLTISQTAAHLGSQGVRAIFTGHGGDEGVSHRMNLTELWEHREYASFFKAIWDTTEGRSLRLLRTAKRSWRQIRHNDPLLRLPYHNTDINTEKFLAPAFRQRMEEKTEKSPLYFAYDPVKYIGQGGSRRRLDNLALQGGENGVRYMIPFLDYRVIDFAVSIPRRLYLKKGVNRWIFREAFREIIPESLYRVRYKDTPSQRGGEAPADQRERFLRVRKQILGWLDREFWREYLDFEAIEGFTLPEDYTPEAYTKAVFALEDLMQCCKLHNTASQSKNWDALPDRFRTKASAGSSTDL